MDIILYGTVLDLCAFAGISHSCGKQCTYLWLRRMMCPKNAKHWNLFVKICPKENGPFRHASLPYGTCEDIGVGNSNINTVFDTNGNNDLDADSICIESITCSFFTICTKLNRLFFIWNLLYVYLPVNDQRRCEGKLIYGSLIQLITTVIFIYEKVDYQTETCCMCLFFRTARHADKVSACTLDVCTDRPCFISELPY